VTQPSSVRIRTAAVDDTAELLQLWALVFDEDLTASEPWLVHAREWFARTVHDPQRARFPVIDVAGELVATAVGTLEIGVPNPHCVHGRSVRLANVITLPAHRGRGHGTAVVRDVIAWARLIGADRIDLGATLSGQRIYEKVGFSVTSAPRMKLVL
jgi:GNAT superfamily N-acetyltransferase